MTNQRKASNLFMDLMLGTVWGPITAVLVLACVVGFGLWFAMLEHGNWTQEQSLKSVVMVVLCIVFLFVYTCKFVPMLFRMIRNLSGGSGIEIAIPSLLHCIGAFLIPFVLSEGEISTAVLWWLCLFPYHGLIILMLFHMDEKGSAVP